MHNLGLAEIMFLIMFTLKLMDKIDHSWWIVVSPMLIVFLFGLLGLLAKGVK